MALSKPDIKGTAQHFLECGVENCERNCEFYCNPCHQQMCKQCRDEHLRNPKTKNHEVVLYQLRKRQLPVKKCDIHPTKDIDLLCEECKIPLCSKCATTEEHRGHVFTDLELIYAEKFSFCLGEIDKVREYFVPSSEDLQREIKEDVLGIKKIIDKLRTSMKAEAESLKSLIDKVVSENMKQLEQIEKSLLEDLKTQDKTLDDYIIYLNKLIKDFHEFISSPDPTKLTLTLSLVDMKIRPIPDTTKPVTPVFTAGQYSREDVAKLLGKISIPEIKPNPRKIKNTEFPINSSQRKLTNIQPFCLTEVRVFFVPGIGYETVHLSLDKSGRLWVSNSGGNLVQTDLQGNQLQMIQTSGGQGYHTVTQDGDLIFTDYYKKVVNRITMDNKISKMIKTKDWEPWSVYSSNITKDILVGMRNGKEAKVTRYNKKGKELQNIQWDNKGQSLYSNPHYITENINGDICTSDYDKKTVVVVDKTGQHRFSYIGQELTFSFTDQKPDFQPFGICTDAYGHILVCDQYTIVLLDQDGQFLSTLLEPQFHIVPLSVCVDDENNIYLGINNMPMVTVYKYLQ
ncbi:uncharacterized protein LOC134262358 [Saccostrea cucullata]|uniref:uncharacterized protein LOC134262358 n=1 Tax=Saccostrea cuccullata TaxID=36930 RepID=UPI002ED14BE7